MHAYSEIYLEDAMDCFGEALDYVSNALEMDTDMFFDMFIAGGYAARFEEGESSIVAGLSGTELVRKVIYECGLEIAFPDALRDFDTISYEYTYGYLLAYLQWYSGRTFSGILKITGPDVIKKYAGEFFEVDDERRIEIASEIFEDADETVHLQEMRKMCDLSQSRLADMAEVNLRTLQQYEIRSKDINKAAASTVLDIARTIGCRVEDILEYKEVLKDNRQTEKDK